MRARPFTSLPRFGTAAAAALAVIRIAVWLPMMLLGVPAGASAFPVGEEGLIPVSSGVAVAVDTVRYTLEIRAGSDSLAARESGARTLWTLDELHSLAARTRDRLLARGAIGSVVRLTLIPGEAPTPARSTMYTPTLGAALLRIESGSAPARIVATVRGGEDVVPDGVRIFEGASGGSGDPRRILAGLEALRREAQARGRYGAEAWLDSIAFIDSATARVDVSLRPGPPVTLDTLDLAGASIRPSVVGAISGLTRGRVLTPAVLEDAAVRLRASDLFASVGPLAVVPGSDAARARVVAPVVENRSSRFEGAMGLQNEGGLTGLIDLALGNIGGTGRSAGARWGGFGAGRSEYAARYREPSLFGKPLDAALALEAQVADSLYTQTRWSLELSGRPLSNALASAALRRSGSAYTGAGRGTSATWSLEGRAAWRALAPRENPARGIAFSLAGEAGRRTESYPGYPRATRALLRAAAVVEVAQPTGGRRALYVAARGEGVSLGGGPLPAEELRLLGGSEGLRGHRDRAFAGDRILAMTVEHRWVTDPRGGRVFLFFDTARHELGVPLEAGTARGALGASLARTVLSPGWEFGYGAGIRSPTRAGTVGIELGTQPGAALREAKLHVRFATDW